MASDLAGSKDGGDDLLVLIEKVKEFAGSLKKSEIALACAAVGGVLVAGAFFAWASQPLSASDLARRAREESRRRPIDADKNDADVKVLLKLEEHEAEAGCEKQVSFNAVVHGNTLSRNATLKIPAGTHDGTIMRLKGLGNTPLRGEQGDLVLEIVVEEP